MHAEINDVFAGIPVSDIEASLDWYTRLFGREPDMLAADEKIWQVKEHAWVFIEPKPANAGTGRVTFTVTGLDELLAQLVARGIEHEPIGTYSNGVRHAKVPDPDGNAIAYGEPPQTG